MALTRVYYIRSLTTGLIKIGISNNVKRRMEQLRHTTGEKLEMIQSYEALRARDTEAHLHNHYSKYRVHGEWFDLRNADTEELAFWAEHEQGMADYWKRRKG